jgi:sulfatase maturation enzyme AslB (radical SAM superfamily)
VELMHSFMPRLKKLMISSNVINRTSVQRQYPRIARYCSKHKIRLTLGVSIDGIGDTHDEIRGVKGAFDKVMESVAFMQRLQQEVPFNLSIDPTIFSMNVHEMQELKGLADRLNLSITFQFAAMADYYYHNADLEQLLKLDDDGRARLVEFLRHHMAELSLFDALAYYYLEVIEQEQGASTRSLPCPFTDQGLLLDPDGSLHYCHNSRPIGNGLDTGSSELYYAAENLAYRKSVWKERCPSCRMSCMFFVSLRKEVFPFLLFIAKRLWLRKK